MLANPSKSTKPATHALLFSLPAHFLKRVKHIAVPVHYVYKKVVKGIIDMEHIPIALQPADPGTKLTSASVSFRAYDYATGVRFYPPVDPEHAKLMDIIKYSADRTFTIPDPSEDSPTLPFLLQQPLPSQMSHNVYRPAKFSCSPLSDVLTKS